MEAKAEMKDVIRKTVSFKGSIVDENNLDVINKETCNHDPQGVGFISKSLKI